MKKISTLLTVMFLFFGITHAQNVYFSGNNDGIGKIWKNNEVVHVFSDTVPLQMRAIQVTDDNSIYSAGHVFNTDSYFGRIWLNDSILFTTDTSCTIERLIVNSNDWTAAGGNKVWQNGETLYTYTIDSTTASNLYALAIDTVTGDIYAGGSLVTPGVYACVWKNDTILWQCSGWSEVKDLCLVGNDLYAAGFVYGNETIDGAIWQNDSIVFQTENGSFSKIASYGGSIYWAGNVMETFSIWEDGEIIYTLPGTTAITALVVNEYGIYYASVTDSIPTIWKDGEILYQPEDCDIITSLAVLPSETPQPEPEVHTLPWFDGFEVDSIWTDWTILDFDSNHDIGWERSDEEAATGDFSARHLASDNIQEGWLITPPLYLRPYCDSTWMSFKTLELNPTSYTSSNLLISTTGTQIADFTEIWAQDNPSDTWDSIHIDLSEYQGDTIRLAFKYSGHHGHDWYIDDVNVEEALTLYDITIESGNPDWGTVSGSGSYPYGDTIQIEAIPNVGHQFHNWHDGNTDNPRNIVVTQDSTFIAQFAINQYTITVVSDHPAWGSVAGGGTFYYGDTITISATPNLGFAFAGWTDGVMTNPRTVVVTEDQTFTAHFEIRQCVITTQVTPEGSGTVNGGGTYNYGETIHLVAHSNTGYVFDIWEDGNITNPRPVFVEGDATFTAVFVPLQYEITTFCDPEEGGTVTGGGIYNYGTVATITAIPNENYSFLCWSDGIVSNPREVTVTQNASYKALFHLNGTPTYTVTVQSNNPLLGTVTGGGEYPEGAVIEISATPSPQAVFTQWDDGITDNPRSITVTQDMTFTAIFEVAETYAIIVRSENPLMGSVYGGGEYTLNTIVTIGATANEGFYFTNWQDGNADNPRNITVTGPATYIASFAQEPAQSYTVTVYFDNIQGYVLGAGSYVAGSTATLAAIPNDGYCFLKWGDGITDNPREVFVDHDITLAAFFNETGVDENDSRSIIVYPNPVNDRIRVEGLEGECEISIYNTLGTCVKRLTLSGNEEIVVGDLAAGLYLLRINGKQTVKFVKR